ncbi:cell wall hydrolase [Brevundimonas faecalis]|uniref:Acyl-homoserine lactone acylase PvdQ n=1 Tax=Brevundimonas faecalis TaxID=947378 RepID=A0ABV2R8F2_9CAUL
MTPRRSIRTVAALALVAALAGPLASQAQTKPPKSTAQTAPAADPVGDLLRARGERYHRAPDSAQDPDELRRTQALNAEITAQNDLAENEDRANAAAFAKAQAQYQAELEQADASARAAQERHEADLRTAAEAQAAYDRQMADWRATVAACERGDRARCNAGRQTPN